jgi:hypothetical protein
LSDYRQQGKKTVEKRNARKHKNTTKMASQTASLVVNYGVWSYCRVPVPVIPVDDSSAPTFSPSESETGL